MNLENLITIIVNNNHFFLIIVAFNILFVFFFNIISRYIPILDKPDNIRKIHNSDIPLLGGLIIAINFSIYTFYYFPYNYELAFISNYREIFSFYIISIIIFIIGLYDDKYSLKPNAKFFLITIILMTSILLDESLAIRELRVDFINRVIPTYEFSIFFTIVCLLLFINALNMFDGINLQVGTYSLIIFIFFLLNNIAVILSLVIMIALIFFLYLNYNNRSFLGDSGSLLLAYIIGYIFIKYYNLGIIENIETIFIIMLIPGLDMLRLFITRIYSGKNAFNPDNNHLHHIFNLYSKKKSYFLIQMMIAIPIVIYFTLFKSVIVIIFSILMYILTIYLLKKIK